MFTTIIKKTIFRIFVLRVDAAAWIADVVAERAPAAVRCADPFHVVAWATEARDEVRRQARNTARGAVNRRVAGRASGTAKALQHARYAGPTPEPPGVLRADRGGRPWLMASA